jgi:hypothetical protein
VDSGQWYSGRTGVQAYPRHRAVGCRPHRSTVAGAKNHKYNTRYNTNNTKYTPPSGPQVYYGSLICHCCLLYIICHLPALAHLQWNLGLGLGQLEVEGGRCVKCGSMQAQHAFALISYKYITLCAPISRALALVLIRRALVLVRACVCVCDTVCGGCDGRTRTTQACCMLHATMLCVS